MKKYGNLFTALLIFIVVFIAPGCRSSRNQSDINNTITPLTIAKGNTAFALSFFNTVALQDDNFVFSPYSISSVMSMIYAGAEGKTAMEMEKTLCFPKKSDALFEEFNNLNQMILAVPDSTEIMKIANGVWIQEDYPVKSGWDRIMKEDYQAPSLTVNFIDPVLREKARTSVNEWTADQTNNRIKEIIPPDILDENTRLILTNALYFKDKWLFSFNKMLTHPDPFYKANGETVKAYYMHITENYRYFENDKLQMVLLPYESQKYSMQILLPKGDLTAVQLIKMLSEPLIEEWYNSLSQQRVDLSLPRFKINKATDVKKILMAMGLTEPFGLSADLSGISGNKELKVDNILHKAFIEVNEEGTEAAAATAAVIGLKSALSDKPVIFNANHPFIFLLTEKASRSVLFAGVVNDPAQKK